MKLAPYPSYRKSEVVWAGSLPASWRTARLRHIGRVNPSASEANGYSSEVPVSFFPMEAVGDDGTVDLSRERPLGEIQGSYSYFRDGDVAIAKVTPCFENGKGAVMSGLANGIGFGSSELTNIRLVRELDPRLFYYYTRTPEVRGLGAASMYGAGGLKRIPDDFFRDFKVPIPSSEEQVAIIAFVDRETAKLDTLIAKQARLIELLQEKRQAVISHAVTKGLDPKAPMRDSGIQWLGLIPAHWKISRLKFATSLIMDCPHETPSYNPLGDYRVIRTADLEQGQLFEAGMYRLEAADYLRRTRRAVLQAGDIVYGREGERWGHAAIVPVSDMYCLGQRMMQFRGSPRTDARFLMWQLNSMPTYRQGQEDTVGATSPHVNVETIRNYWLTEPPHVEQQSIAQFIDGMTWQIDVLIEKARTSIELMREHRSALISAAVTGKIDVRCAA